MKREELKIRNAQIVGLARHFGFSHTELAARYGVCVEHIGQIIRKYDEADINERRMRRREKFREDGRKPCGLFLKRCFHGENCYHAGECELAQRAQTSGKRVFAHACGGGVRGNG